MSRPEMLTFDCYGTLIDWCGGLSLALSRLDLPPAADRDALFQRYVRVEHEIESGPYAPYREVTARALARTLAEAGLGAPPGTENVLADSIVDWAPFPEVPRVLAQLRRRVPLAIVSNIDDDLLEGSVRRIGVPFDHRITAQQVRSYKPGIAHFRAIQERTGLRPGQLLHVGASLIHDMAPCRDLAIPCVWINRRAEPVPPWFPAERALPDLERLPDLAFGR